MFNFDYLFNYNLIKKCMSNLIQIILSVGKNWKEGYGSCQLTICTYIQIQTWKLMKASWYECGSMGKIKKQRKFWLSRNSGNASIQFMVKCSAETLSVTPFLGQHQVEKPQPTTLLRRGFCFPVYFTGYLLSIRRLIFWKIDRGHKYLSRKNDKFSR